MSQEHSHHPSPPGRKCIALFTTMRQEKEKISAACAIRSGTETHNQRTRSRRETTASAHDGVGKPEGVPLTLSTKATMSTILPALKI